MMKNRALFLSFAGFFICFASFLLAAIVGKNFFTTLLFVVGFVVGALGVLIGFFTFRQDKKN